jgi:hypothetical protein
MAVAKARIFDITLRAIGMGAAGYAKPNKAQTAKIKNIPAKRNRVYLDSFMTGDKEIARKIATGYPLINTIFENTKRAVLFQNKRRLSEFNLHNPTEVSDLLTQFFTYTEPDIATFEAAVQEFKERVPELARALLTIIEREYKLNKKFITAFDAFAELCRQSLEWVIDQYQMSEDKRSGIVSDPNNLDDEEYIVRLVGKVVTVSVETVRLVNELAMAVRMEDWMGE